MGWTNCFAINAYEIRFVKSLRSNASQRVPKKKRHDYRPRPAPSLSFSGCLNCCVSDESVRHGLCFALLGKTNLSFGRKERKRVEKVVIAASRDFHNRSTGLAGLAKPKAVLESNLNKEERDDD